MAELAEDATRKETAVGNSVILTTSVIGFLMYLKSPKFRNFISKLILCSILAVNLMGVLITEGSQLDSRFCSHILKKTRFEGDKNNLTIQSIFRSMNKYLATHKKMNQS